MNPIHKLQRWLVQRSNVPAWLVVAHPDDEVIGVGAHLGVFASGAIIHVTNGAPRDAAFAHQAGFQSVEAYASARRAELGRVLSLAGIPAHICDSLDYVDQEAAMHLVDITKRLANRMIEEKPAWIMTHPYEGGHPDHDACAFSVWAASETLRRKGYASPVRIEMTSYHIDEGKLHAGAFLPSSGHDVLTAALTMEQRKKKRALMDLFVSQKEMLSLFSDESESFRWAPEYDFSTPPHSGKLYYESLMWPITGADFCAYAKEAIRNLGL